MNNLNRFQWIIHISILGGLLSILTSCQSSPIKDFEKVTLGHDKSDVIEFVGGPSWADRKDGFDRWTYIIYQDGVRLEREVRFLSGTVAYIGEPIKPFVTAEEQDVYNAEKNRVLDRMERNQTATSPNGNSNEVLKVKSNEEKNTIENNSK